jgi:hypothetical protein
MKIYILKMISKRVMDLPIVEFKEVKSETGTKDLFGIPKIDGIVLEKILGDGSFGEVW